jgi:hypothetical protein
VILPPESGAQNSTGRLPSSGTLKKEPAKTLLSDMCPPLLGVIEDSMMATRTGCIGELPYLWPGLSSGRVTGSLGPVAEAELRQHVPHVMLDRFPGDVETLRYLRIG